MRFAAIAVALSALAAPSIAAADPPAGTPPILGTLLFFCLRELLSDYGAWYMILLGVLAVVAMLRFPQGLWGLLTERWDVHVFPLQRRVRVRE